MSLLHGVIRRQAHVTSATIKFAETTNHNDDDSYSMTFFFFQFYFVSLRSIREILDAGYASAVSLCIAGVQTTWQQTYSYIQSLLAVTCATLRMSSSHCTMSTIVYSVQSAVWSVLPGGLRFCV